MVQLDTQDFNENIPRNITLRLLLLVGSEFGKIAKLNQQWEKVAKIR